MIFSLLNVRKKTAAALAGIAIALACLWGLAMWQDISREEMLSILMATVIMLLVIVVCAVLLIVAFKLLMRLLRKIVPAQHDNNIFEQYPDESTDEESGKR